MEEQVRRKGLGKFLMQTLELVARRSGMEAMYLTVPGANTGGFAFYRSLKYEKAVYVEDDELEIDDVIREENRGKRAAASAGSAPAAPDAAAAAVEELEVGEPEYDILLKRFAKKL